MILVPTSICFTFEAVIVQKPSENCEHSFVTSKIPSREEDAANPGSVALTSIAVLGPVSAFGSPEHAMAELSASGAIAVRSALLRETFGVLILYLMA